MKKKRRKRTLNKYEDLAKELQSLLGNSFDIKYYANLSVDWEKIIIDDNMVYGAIKVLGGTNQSVREYKTTTTEVGLTLMVKEESYADTIDSVINALLGIDKQFLLLGEEYNQFIYGYQADLGQYYYNGNKYNGVTITFSLITFDNLFLGDSQAVSITIGGEITQLLGVTGVNYKCQCAYDGAVNNTALQKNYLSSVNETIQIDGLVVKDDVARKYVKQHLKDNTKFTITYFDGEAWISLDAKLISYDCNGISGNTIKYQMVFIQKG